MEGQIVGMAARQWLAGQWLADGSMDSVVEINSQCLEYLGAMAAHSGRGCSELFAGQLSTWRKLPAVALAQLAASPYLLADAGFDDEQRWRALEQRMVHDLPRSLAEPVFVGPGANDFIRRVLVFGWHLARANRQL
jgi:hypothetical protein